MDELVLICEDSIDGILTGVYEAYQFKKNEGIESHEFIHVSAGEPERQRLFTHYEYIKTDMGKSKKVIQTVKRELGEDTYYFLCLTMASNGLDKADAVYHTIVLGLLWHDKNVFARLHDSYVQRAFEYQRNTNNEILHLRGFLRFAELDQGILYAKIGPKNNVLSYLMPHFSDRLPAENFVIYDDTRNLFGLHPKQKPWYLVGNQEFDESSLVFSADEEVYCELFCHFCEKIAIKERVNPKLQMNMLPLRFRPYMVEFMEKSNESVTVHR